jgi:hypothetical protein
MAETPQTETYVVAQRNFSPVAGFLSCLGPGLGQIVQGRIGKGLLFLVCLYFLFFFGEYLGNWRNVYIADGAPAQAQGRGGRFLEVIADRARFFAQFWIGVAAWPAIVQYKHSGDNPLDKEHPYLGNYQRRPNESELNIELRNSDKSPDLGWMYTVIAGVHE